jgi:putative transposase
VFFHAKRREALSDNGQNRDYWPFYQLETFVAYKAALRSIPVAKIPAPYTSKTHHDCGRPGVRKSNDFYCPHYQNPPRFSREGASII